MRTGLIAAVVFGAGSAWGAGPATKAAPRSSPVRFNIDVMAVLTKAGCNQGLCHGNLSGKGGFNLSLRGQDPDADLASLTHDLYTRRANPFDPDSSLMLRKATGILPHEGGVRFDVGSIEYNILRTWIAGGVRPDPADAPTLDRLDVSPRESSHTAPDLAQKLTVIARFSDGSTRDVSGMACYDVSNQSFKVSPAGEVSITGPGEGTVLVRYLDHMTTARLTFLSARPNFVWSDVRGHNFIDEHVFAKLKATRSPPSDLCSDSVFLRRAYLDLLGRPPSPIEARAFLKSEPTGSLEKRAKLIDELLDHPEYTDFWALKWADVLRADPLMLDTIGAAKFQRWIRRAVATDRPLDEFVRDLLTGSGSTYHDPAAAYYRIQRNPSDLAENTAQLFLGVRLKCARCHNHPAERWTQADYYGLAAFFAHVTRKNFTKQDSQNNTSAVLGEEWISTDGTEEVIDGKGKALRPRVPADPARNLPAREFVQEPADRRTLLADWLTGKDNPYFARALANRIWYHLIGRGIVEPVDDFRDSNPPSNPALLDALAAELVRGGFRTKPLIRAIMNSRTYQTSSAPRPENIDDEINFSHPAARRLSAEQLLDAVSDVTGVAEKFDGMPAGMHAVQLPGGKTNHPFLKTFGKPTRLTVCECERTDDVTLSGSFLFISGPTISEKIASQENRIGKMLAEKKGNDEIVEELYLAALSRLPKAEERSAIAKHLAGRDRRTGLEDVLWALLNSKEFLFRQ